VTRQQVIACTSPAVCARHFMKYPVVNFFPLSLFAVGGQKWLNWRTCNCRASSLTMGMNLLPHMPLKRRYSPLTCVFCVSHPLYGIFQISDALSVPKMNLRPMASEYYVSAVLCISLNS